MPYKSTAQKIKLPSSMDRVFQTFLLENYWNKNYIGTLCEICAFISLNFANVRYAVHITCDYYNHFCSPAHRGTVAFASGRNKFMRRIIHGRIGNDTIHFRRP